MINMDNVLVASRVCLELGSPVTFLILGLIIGFDVARRVKELIVRGSSSV
ncbi:hypothetical protein [Brevibacillus laterosporus]